MSILTLGEAAKMTGMSKPTISKAVLSGKVTGIKGENGVFQIEKSELIRVYPEKTNKAGASKSTSATKAGSAVAELENKHLAEQVADLQARLSKTEDRLETAEIREREANARVFVLIEDQRPKSIWQKITGK